MFNVYEFRWKALSRFQQRQKGKLLAENIEYVEKILISKGYSEIKISRNFILPTTPKQENITQFIAQLSLLINSSIPIKQALSMLLESCDNIKLYLWTKEIISFIESGYSLSHSLEKLNRYIQPQEVQLIKMGENSGNLGLILQNIATAREKSEQLAKKVKKIMFYPVIILSVSLLLSILLLIFIVPQFAELYGTKNKTLPLITEMLFILSSFLQEYIYGIICCLLLCTMIFFFLSKRTNFISFLKMAILTKLPVFNQIISYARIVFFSQNLALMLKSSVRLDIALSSFLSEKVSDPILDREIKLILTLLKQGYKFSEGLNPNIFNSQTIQMVMIGERSGKLAYTLEHISNIHQQKLDYQIDMLSQLLEPMLMLIMGIIVGTIIVGLYLPIFDMGTLVE